MYVESDKIEIYGLVLSEKEWLSFANNISEKGERAFAAMFYRILYQYAIDNNKELFAKQCQEGLRSIDYSCARPYRIEGATDPNNRQRMKWVRDENIDIFDFKLDEGEIIKAIQTIDFKGLKGRKYWFVFHRIFEELNWLTVTKDNTFADWVTLYFQWSWERDKPWRTVDKEIRTSHSWQWNENTVPNSDIGKKYAALSKKVWSVFTDKPKKGDTDKPIDKDIFYLLNMNKINNGK